MGTFPCPILRQVAYCYQQGGFTDDQAVYRLDLLQSYVAKRKLKPKSQVVQTLGYSKGVWKLVFIFEEIVGDHLIPITNNRMQKLSNAFDTWEREHVIKIPITA
jgi:hypothetical protein